MHNFTPIPALLGGALIGVAATLLWLGQRRVAGISGILSGLFQPGHERAWRVLFVVGLLLGGLAVALLWPAAIGTPTRSLVWLAAGGLLVGFGARISGGCTSGHGVCGLSHLSKRSLGATLSFMIAGGLAVIVLQHGAGAP